ncbi:hypothetical protein PhCBS80983_g03389 [Powellomyces hirtus]|uniref:non-specific serine/threonine protein kinase n=1 Tax=Powellomyces hirtus TaxID=109895 RepID=A0A507E445_9FUNG|nr:hypothetical protein PhCBS80983_g03389 [Powellomyces hirtus]
MSVQQYGKNFPILLRTPSPRGHVELLETIGKGNYGYVYKGRLLATKEISAVKVVFLKEDELRETLLEMEILEQCSHPNITRYMGCYLKGLDLWICMEFCGGGALDSVYRAIRKPLTEDQIASILYESVKGLDYLHTKVALIHRDIKAGNVLLTDSGECKLADFGVSAKLSSVGGRARTFIGTPYWMAPEVIMTDPESATHGSASYDAKADIWSIGITAIEIAEKNPPLSDIHPMRALTLIPNSELGLSKPKNWSKSLQDFIAVCLIKDPLQRPSAAQLLQHPFLARAGTLPRQKIMADLVQKAKMAREKKKAGHDVDDDDDDDEKKEEVPAKAVAETMKQAKQAKQQLQAMPQMESPTYSTGSTAAPTSPMEAPTFTETLIDADSRILEPVLIGGTQRMDVLTADLLDETYVLVGTEKGLFFADVRLPSSEQRLVPLIRNIRFKQLEILQDYGVMIALSGKHDHVRQYKLSSLRKLIMYIEGANAQGLVQSDARMTPGGIPNGRPSTTTGITSTSAPTGTTASSDRHSNMSPPSYARPQSSTEGDDDMYRGLHPVVEEDEAVLVTRWTSDYIKILATRDSKAFMVQRTETSVFLAVLFRHDVIMFEWAKEPYLKFMKLKAFWLPEGPKCMQILHDGLVVREIFLGYSSEANLVNVDDSRVKEIEVQRDFRHRAGKGSKARWQTFVQIPFTDAVRRELRAASVNVTVNRKLAAVARAPGKKAAYSSSAPKPDRYFLGTYHRLTRVVDLNGQIMMGSGVGGWNNGFQWREPPSQLMLRPVDWVFGLGNNGIEVVDWRSATLVQTLALDKDVNLRVLNGQSGPVFVSIERKKKGCVLYWMKEKKSSAPLDDTPSAMGSHASDLDSKGSGSGSLGPQIDDSQRNPSSVSGRPSEGQVSSITTVKESVIKEMVVQVQGISIQEKGRSQPSPSIHSPTHSFPSSAAAGQILDPRSTSSLGPPSGMLLGSQDVQGAPAPASAPHPIRTVSNASSISSGRRSGPASPSGSPAQHRREQGGQNRQQRPSKPTSAQEMAYYAAQNQQPQHQHVPHQQHGYQHPDPRYPPDHPRNAPYPDMPPQPYVAMQPPPQQRPQVDPRYAPPPSGYGYQHPPPHSYRPPLPRPDQGGYAVPHGPPRHPSDPDVRMAQSYQVHQQPSPQQVRYHGAAPSGDPRYNGAYQSHTGQGHYPAHPQQYVQYQQSRARPSPPGTPPSSQQAGGYYEYYQTGPGGEQYAAPGSGSSGSLEGAPQHHHQHQQQYQQHSQQQYAQHQQHPQHQHQHQHQHQQQQQQQQLHRSTSNPRNDPEYGGRRER